MQLTLEQQETVEANMPLAVFLAKRRAQQRKDMANLDEYLAAAYLGLCEGVADYDPARNRKLSAWLSQKIAWAFATGKRRAGMMVLPEGDALPEERGAAADLEAVEARVDLERLLALADLTPRDRRILERRMEGASLRELAEEEGLSHVRVHELYHRALRRMREAANAA